MNLKTKIAEAVAAAFSGIWVQSYEHADAIREIAESCVNQQGWNVAIWDAVNGTRIGENQVAGDDPSPITALNYLLGQASVADIDTDKIQRHLLIMRNLHPFLSDPSTGRILLPPLLQKLQQVIETGESSGLHVIVLSYPGIKIPLELEKMFLVVEHNLPDAEELWRLAQEIEEDPKNLPARHSPEGELLLNAAAGLTRLEASGAFSLSIARRARILPDTIWELKEGMLKKAGLLQMCRPTTGFEMLGGLQHVKDFTLRSLNSPTRSKVVRPKGIMLLGLPGVGKSAFAKALGHETGLPTLLMDIGSLMGGIVGETEGNTRRALQSIDAMAPCILFIDEIEKALAGAGGGARDSGVSDRMFGTFLTWLNDHESEVYVVATANDIQRLAAASSGAFTRAGRFDAIFFVDLPVAEQKEKIWEIWLKYYAEHGLTPAQVTDRPKDVDWTGAEIQDCCLKATLQNISLVDAAKQVVPIVHTSKEQIDSLREWAHRRCLSADYHDVFDKNGAPKNLPEMSLSSKPRRRVART